MSDPDFPDEPAFFRTSWTTAVDSPEVLQRKLTEQRLRADQLHLLGSAVSVSHEGIAILTPAVEVVGPRFAFVNEGFCAIYGYTREEVIGQTLQAFGIVEAHHAILNAMLDHVFEDRAFAGEATARRKDGTEFELDVQVTPVEDGGQLSHWVAFVRDVTESRHQMVALRYQAMHDSLTDLPNRVMLFDALEKAIVAARERNNSVALLLMDLDRFKEVNDTFGHAFGDLLLKQVAYRLRNQLGGEDTVSRLGGDEFAIILPDPMDSSRVANTARRILNTLEQPFVIEGQVLEVGASIGIAVYPNHGSDVRTLLRRADVAMYSAKQSQSGYTFHRDDQERSPDQLALVVEMRSAIERNEFELHYQPKLHLRTGLMTRVEVLIRWRHPTRGLLSPALFIPIAERTGLIKNLTDWIFDRALQQCRAWLDVGAPVHLAINVSTKSLQEQAFPARVNSLLEKWGVDPRFLKIEITESSIMADPAHALAILSLLQSIGVRLSMDDFGTGYSSLTHIRQLPIDEIKVDQSFVMGMTANEADAAIVRTMIDLGHNLGKQVCAEGVENVETWQMLADLGCDLAQGFWISKPLPADDLMQWLVRSAWGLKTIARMPARIDITAAD